MQMLKFVLGSRLILSAILTKELRYLQVPGARTLARFDYAGGCVTWKCFKYHLSGTAGNIQILV